MSQPLPANHQSVMPYLIVDNATRFLEFTQNAFNAELVSRHQREGEDKIMHAEIRIGDSTIMFADAVPEWPPYRSGLFLYVENADETYEKAMANGGRPVMEPTDKDYGRTCGVLDPAGNTWWITAFVRQHGS